MRICILHFVPNQQQVQVQFSLHSAEQNNKANITNEKSCPQEIDSLYNWILYLLADVAVDGVRKKKK